MVIGGPIASGKSTLAQAVASRIEDARGVAPSVLWTQARRVAGRIATVLLGEGGDVVAEGDFATDKRLVNLKPSCRLTPRVRLVMLHVDFDTALERVRADSSRGASKDRAFLAVDTGGLALAEAARLVVESSITVR